ncbi:hypothetical protein DFH11DRAFT_1168132 [Phellopilus nigrolimitatus]|nr:hypothetical protein DFH11DRAFT_1168132 [Phellopilus nigrolimitatus]
MSITDDVLAVVIQQFALTPSITYFITICKMSYEDFNILGDFGRYPFDSSMLSSSSESGSDTDIFNSLREASEPMCAGRSLSPICTPELSHSPHTATFSPDSPPMDTADFALASFNHTYTVDPRMLLLTPPSPFDTRPEFPRLWQEEHIFPSSGDWTVSSSIGPALDLLLEPVSIQKQQSIAVPRPVSSASRACGNTSSNQKKTKSSISIRISSTKRRAPISTGPVFTCEHEGCGATYDTSRSLSRHERTHGGGRYFCACGRGQWGCSFQEDGYERQDSFLRRLKRLPLNNECVLACEKKGWSRNIRGSAEVLLCVSA